MIQVSGGGFIYRDGMSIPMARIELSPDIKRDHGSWKVQCTKKIGNTEYACTIEPLEDEWGIREKISGRYKQVKGTGNAASTEVLVKEGLDVIIISGRNADFSCGGSEEKKTLTCSAFH
jgi:hypothetical protein